MRPVIIAANWKMHTTPAEAGRLAGAMAVACTAVSVVRVICPPFVALGPVAEALAGTGVAVGAQNVHQELAGAYTGEIAAPMLVGLASWCIVGHSERRRDFDETDALVGQKLGRCLEVGLRPILCVGEQLADREAGRAEAVVSGQLRGALAGLETASLGEGGGLVVAYEPVWAIGTGRAAHGADAARMADAIREALAELADADLARATPILYGGSVTAAGVGEFLAEPGIDGALVGGASLKVEEMAGIVARAALTAEARAAAEAKPAAQVRGPSGGRPTPEGGR
ncbi:MAG TPA: triose-phosphate isomerase [Candidatus Limnocylindrales bacterium]|nr:triose-phosphate isomerase [Candidatus Limnocylindrales bacterium]